MNDDDVQALRAQFRALQRRLRKESGGDGTLSESSLRVLRFVETSDHAVTPGEITQSLDMTTSNVASTLRTLERARALQSRRDQSDGRRILLAPTVAGRALLDEHRRTRDAWLLRTIEEVLDEEEQRVVLRAGELLQRVTEHAAQRGVPVR
jgi:DNA-binding MarR family transcriptional regulator